MGDVLSGGGRRPRLREHWSALPRAARRLVLTAAGVALLAAVTGYALTRPDPGTGPHPGTASTPSPARPVPYPVHSTRITFVRIHEVAPTDRTFEVELRARTAVHPVLVERIGQEYATVDMGLRPSHPVRVEPGRPKPLRLHARVTSCRGLPLRAQFPYLDVTLRNARAPQELSFILGERYARSLTRAFRTVCGPSSGAFAGTP